jgi:hypothetical protein
MMDKVIEEKYDEVSIIAMVYNENELKQLILMRKSK